MFCDRLSTAQQEDSEKQVLTNSRAQADSWEEKDPIEATAVVAVASRSCSRIKDGINHPYGLGLKSEDRSDQENQNQFYSRYWTIQLELVLMDNSAGIIRMMVGTMCLT